MNLAVVPDSCQRTMSTLADRIKQAIEHAGLNQAQVETRAKLSKGYLSRVASGSREPKTGNLAAIASACGVDVGWLSTGSGPMTRPGVTVVRDDAPPVDLSDAVSPLEAAIGAAFKAERHTIRDIDAVRKVLRSSGQLQATDADLKAAAEAWLDAAAQLRREDLPVTTELLLFRVTVARKPGAMDVARAEQREADDLERQKAEAAAKGIEWGSKRGALERVTNKKPRGGD